MRQLAAACLLVGASAGLPGPLPRAPAGPVLKEPSPQDHYGFLRNYEEKPLSEFVASKGPPVVRVKNLEDATFQQLVRDGSPFVVDDCTHDFDQDAISNFECKDFAKRWPSGNMRAEYTQGQYHINLKDKDWHTKIYPQRSNPEHMAGDRKIAGPYIWHVKDEEPLKTKRSVQKHWRTPYFLRNSFANRMEANESFEFWFSMAGGGTFTHADAYCETTISMQFRGKKRWRLQSFPRVEHYLNATGFSDEKIYNNKLHKAWTPETEVMVGPGQCFVFPTGYLHETFVDPEGNEEGCFTASTFQFNHPRQVNLYRSYLSSFAMSHYGMTEPCFANQAASYANLLSTAKVGKTKTLEASSQEAERIMALIDKDKDDKLTTKEIYDHFCVNKATRKRIVREGNFEYGWYGLLKKEGRAELEEEAMNVWAEDAKQYHDVDKDGFVSVEELAQSFLQWHVVHARLKAMQQGKDIKNPKKWLEATVAQEVDYLKKHFCEEGAPCKAADDVIAYAEVLKKSKSKLNQCMSNIKRMLESEEEGDNEELEMFDRESGQGKRQKVKDIKTQEL